MLMHSRNTSLLPSFLHPRDGRTDGYASPKSASGLTEREIVVVRTLEWIGLTSDRSVEEEEEVVCMIHSVSPLQRVVTPVQNLSL